MKKIKLFIVFIVAILLLVGCQKEYTLTISDDKIVEEFDLVVPNTDENEELINLNYYPLHANDEVLFTKNVKDEGEFFNVHLEHTYIPEEFSNANSINECFVNKEVILDNEDYYYIKLEKLTKCMTDYEFNVNIITNNKVLSNNADKVDGNKYTWYLNDENKDNFNLEIKISKSKKINNSNLIKIVGFAIVVIVVAILMLYLAIKRKKSNSI